MYVGANNNVWFQSCQHETLSYQGVKPKILGNNLARADFCLVQDADRTQNPWVVAGFDPVTWEDKNYYVPQATDWANLTLMCKPY